MHTQSLTLPLLPWFRDLQSQNPSRKTLAPPAFFFCWLRRHHLVRVCKCARMCVRVDVYVYIGVCLCVCVCVCLCLYVISVGECGGGILAYAQDIEDEENKSETVHAAAVDTSGKERRVAQRGAG